jgi:aspartate-semialdehyde dehydrogenase
MVGSVLMQRMREEGDFAGLDASFFSTSAAGGEGPEVDGKKSTLLDAFDMEALAAHEVLVTCQGGSYTKDVYPRLRESGWDGYFIDAARELRMADDSVLILDPVNMPVIERGLRDGMKTYCGPNCTVSLMLLAIDGLLKADVVEWVSSMTYQAASGGGAKHMRELIAQMAMIGDRARDLLDDPSASALQLDARVTQTLRGGELPTDNFAVPLAGSLIPWIDQPVEGGQTREEWKAMSEGNKILGKTPPLPFDGVCVRVGAMRSHAQGLTIKLKRDIPLDEINAMVAEANDWVKLIANEPEATRAGLSPAAVSGTLEIAIGRMRKMHMGGEYLAAFTVGDQLLWGAAEPLRRMLGILRQHRAA